MTGPSPKTLSRRTVLRGIGTAISLPMIDAMLPTRLLSATASTVEKTPPLRMGFFYVPNGMHMAHWTPRQIGTGYDLGPTLQPLAAHQKNVSVLTGLTLENAFAQGDGGGDHARSVAAFLTGSHPRKTKGANLYNGVSVDQLAAQHLGATTRFASLELGIEPSAQAGQCDAGYSCAYTSNMSWRNPTSPVAKEIDPAAVFDRLFAGQSLPESKRARDLRMRFRKSILDLAQEDAKHLTLRLGASDRRKLDQYLYSVRDIEKRVVQTDRLETVEPEVPDYPRPTGIPADLTSHCRLMLDMVALALQTDNTRIVSFMFANAGSNRSYPDQGVHEGHHDVSHHGKSLSKQEKIAKINLFHAQQFGYLLDRLASINEGERTLLDNCMLVYGSGISDGDRHNHDDLPILLAGGGGGHLPTGSHIRYPNGTPICNLYLWMLRQIGAPVKQFGDSTGKLAFR